MRQPSPTRPGVSIARRTLGAAALAGLAATSLAIVAGAEHGLTTLVPSATERYPGWLHGPLSGLTLAVDSRELSWLLIAMFAFYLLALVSAHAVPRAALAAIAGLHLLFLIGPPLYSSDVFGYVDIARLGTLHGVNPYSPKSTPLPPDSVHLYRRWGTDVPSPYGPLFTLVSYALVPLGIAGAMWGFKVLVAAGSLLTVWLVYRCAERLGRDPVRAALFVGLNPLLLVWAVGGAHNDFFALPLVAGAVYLAIGERERLSGAALAVAATVKLPLGLPLLFAAARPGAARRRTLIVSAVAAAAVVAAISLIAFGSQVTGFLTAIRDQQDMVATNSVPNKLGQALGLGGVTAGIRVAAAAALVAAIALGVRSTWRGGDWIAAAGWATLALLATSAWLLPWYLTWLLPLAAIAGDRRLRGGTLALAAYVIATRLTL